MVVSPGWGMQRFVLGPVSVPRMVAQRVSGRRWWLSNSRILGCLPHYEKPQGPHPISRSALDKNPMPGHLFEGNPVEEGTKRRGTDTPMHLLETPAGSTHSLSRALRPPERLERQAEFPSSDKTIPDSPCYNRTPAPHTHGPFARELLVFFFFF